MAIEEQNEQKATFDDWVSDLVSMHGGNFNLLIQFKDGKIAGYALANNTSDPNLLFSLLDKPEYVG